MQNIRLNFVNIGKTTPFGLYTCACITVIILWKKIAVPGLTAMCDRF